MPNPRTIVFIGTYNRGQGPGILTFEFNAADGSLHKLGETTGIANPSFLALTADGRFLYSVCEVDGVGGSVAAFMIDPKSLALTPINTQPSHGSGPCHIHVDPAGRSLFVANYGDGVLASYPLRPDGSIAPAGSVHRHRGKSKDPERQEGPHAHSINLDPAGRFALAVDLGTDEVLCFKVDHAAGRITPNDPFATRVKPGAGPRHLAFAPHGRQVYVINELDSTMLVFDYDAQAGRLTQTQSISTLDPDATLVTPGVNYPAEVRPSPDGRFLYGSNRRQDNIVVYAVHPRDGALTRVQNQGTHVKEPRHFNVSPRGDYLIVGNQTEDRLAVFRIDASSGKLIDTDRLTPAPTPVCVQFLIVK